jgi:hypothetical protein
MTLSNNQKGRKRHYLCGELRMRGAEPAFFSHEAMKRMLWTGLKGFKQNQECELEFSLHHFKHFVNFLLWESMIDKVNETLSLERV